MRDISQIMARTIASLGYSPQTRNFIVQSIERHRNPDFDFGFGEKRLKLCEQLAKKFTVKDFMDLYNAEVSKEQVRRRNLNYYGTNPLIPEVNSKISYKLVKLGLTQLDWIALPNDSVTISMLRRFGKIELLGRSVLILGTLSANALKDLEKYFEKDSPDITIHDLITISEEAWDWAGTLKRSIVKTRQRLREIGFGYEDGIFLQEGTKRQLIEDLQKAAGLNRKATTRVVDVLQKRRLLKKLFFESDVGL